MKPGDKLIITEGFEGITKTGDILEVIRINTEGRPQVKLITGGSCTLTESKFIPYKQWLFEQEMYGIINEV